MRPETLLLSSLWASTALAFQDISPFFLFSTSDFQHPPSREVANSQQLQKDLLQAFQSCPSDLYVLVNQPGVTAEDYRGKNAALNLRRRASGEDGSIQSRTIIPGIIGTELNVPMLAKMLQTKCGATTSNVDFKTKTIHAPTKFPHVLQVFLPKISASGKERATQLSYHDEILDAALGAVEGKSYTVVYTTSPPKNVIPAHTEATNEIPASEANLHFDWDAEDSPHELLHSELKRDFTSGAQKRQESPSPKPNARNVGLFEKYNFLSPGVFMGLLAVIVLGAIGLVGIRALSSLQVSYAAFSKEMGTSQQKKQQ